LKSVLEVIFTQRHCNISLINKNNNNNNNNWNEKKRYIKDETIGHLVLVWAVLIWR